MSEARDHGPRLGPLPRPLALALIGVWALLTIVALIATLRTGPAWSGELEGLLPEHDRSPRDRVLVLLRVNLDVDVDVGAQPGEGRTDEADELDPRTLLAEAGFAIEEAFADRRVPLAPPKTEITRWLDAHALYLLPIETHAALAERLADEAMRAQVQGLVARLSSPLYAVSGDQPRRDPLAVHELTDREAGRLGHVAEVPGSDAPQVSASGDLIGAGGDRALIALLSEADEDLEQLRTQLEAAIEPLPISIALIHPRVQQTALALALQRDAPALVGACLAGLVLLLSLSLRKVAPVLVLVAVLGSIALVLSWAAPGLDVLSLAVVIVALGLSCDLALQPPRIGQRKLAAPLLAAGALAPLWLSPYPLWHGWAVVWPAALLSAALVLRLVFPALLALLGSELTWGPPTLRWTPSAIVALLVCVGLCGAAIGVAPKLGYRAQLPVALSESDAELERELIEHFFDPSMIVEARTRADPDPDPDQDPDERLGNPAAAALDAAASELTPLAALVPGEARRIDSPASFVLPRAELEARKQALARLKLGERMEVLKLLLAERGLRAEAFTEFVHGAADIEDLPSAAAALDGPLGPWIRAYLSGEGDETELRTRVELRGRASLPMVTFSRERMAELPPLRGPAIAAMVDQRELSRRFGLVLVAGAWLTALLVWLGTASLGIALAAALVGVTSQAGVVVGLSLLDQPIGPQLLPVLLVVATAAALAGARACAAVARGEAIAWPPIVTAAACLLVAGAALLSSAQPLWRELGVALAIGSVLACTLGLFVTPGLARLLRGLPAAKPAEAKA